MSKFDTALIDLVESASRTMKTTPLNLGGVAGSGGGVGSPPGGYVGWLPQGRVAYDYDEIASSGTPASGMSLVDNLNHIRYRLNTLESGGSIIVTDDNNSLSYNDTTNLHFVGSGVVVTDLGGGEVQIEIDATGTGSGIPDAPIDGSTYGRKDGSWVTVSGGGSIDAFGWEQYLLSSTLSDVATYYYMKNSTPTLAGFAGGVTGSDYLWAKFISEASLPSATTVSEVSAKLYAASSSNLGTVSVDAYAKLYKRDAGGTETLLGTSNTVNIPQTTYSYYTFTFSGSFSIASTDRLVLKFYGTVVGGSPAYTFVNVNIGTTGSNPVSCLTFKSSYGPIDGIYFDDEYNVTSMQSGVMLIDFNEELLKYKYLKLNADNGIQEITRNLIIYNDTDGEGVIYGYSTGDATTAEFDQLTDSTDVFSPVLYLYQTTNTAVNSGIMIQGYRNIDTTGSFADDFILLEDIGGQKFRVDKDGNVYSAGSLLIADAVSDGSTYGRKNGAWVAISGGGGLSHYYNDDLTSQIPKTISGVYTTSVPYASGTLRVYFNGIRQRKNYHYEELSGYATFRAFFPTYSGDMMIVDFDY